MSCPTYIFCQFYIIQGRNFYIVLQLKKSEAVTDWMGQTILCLHFPINTLLAEPVQHYLQDDQIVCI